MPLMIRLATQADARAIWCVMEPAIRAGETYTLARELSESAALAYWMDSAHEVHVAETADGVVGTYFLRANQAGGGAHVANCGYMTAARSGGQGIGRAMCLHSLERARARGFHAMQFNFVVSSNDRAVRLWQSVGFTIVGRLPSAFLHPSDGYVDAYVMYLTL